MLSILIPIYNVDCRQLAEDLIAQADASGIEYELLAYDDGSTSFKEENRQLQKYPCCRYVEMGNNIGRSAIRNRLAQDAQFPYLIFMDCDSRVIGSQYIDTYIDSIGKSPVICGGRYYSTREETDPRCLLHWLYGTQREPKPDEKNTMFFLSNNFLIEKRVFDTIRFDESIKGYGHEDTVFGIALQKNKLAVSYIYNPLLHEGLQTNDEFLEKTGEGVCNLHYLYCHVLSREDAVKIKLLRIYNIMEKWKLTSLIALFYRYANGYIIRRICNKEPSLLWLDIYKLGLLCSLKKETTPDAIIQDGL